MDKITVAHIYNGILLSHRMKWNWVLCSNVDEPRVCHTEWSESEGEKQILYINAYVYFGHLMHRVDSLEKTLMLWGTGGRRRRGWQNEMAGWHHWLYEHESEWTPGVGDGQGGLECCDSWGHKESDMTERLNWCFLCGSAVKICLQCRRCRSETSVGKIPWRRAWQPTLVFLPGESHGQRSLAGYSP